MAHNIHIDRRTGQAAMFSANVAAWHNLGTVTDGCLTWQDAMKTAHLDWTVSKHQLTGPYGLVDCYGIFRDDTQAFLGACGKDYGIVDNKYAFEFVDALIEAEDSAHYESAGALGDGGRIWCLARVNGDMTIAGTDDKHHTYLLFTTSHDGSLAATCKLTTVRVVCQNTLTAALKGSGAFCRVKHTVNATRRLDAAKSLMQGTQTSIKELEDKLNALATRQVQKDSFIDTMQRLFGKWENDVPSAKSKGKIDSIARLFESNDNNAIPEIRGTAYNLLNAVTEYTDHLASFRRTEGREGMTDAAIRSENALFGLGAQVKEQALEVILETTKNDPYHQIMRRYVTVPTETPKPTTSLLDAIIDNN